MFRQRNKKCNDFVDAKHIPDSAVSICLDIPKNNTKVALVGAAKRTMLFSCAETFKSQEGNLTYAEFLGGATELFKNSIDAGATNITVSFSPIDEDMICTVADNGKGVELDKLDKNLGEHFEKIKLQFNDGQLINFDLISKGSEKILSPKNNSQELGGAGKGLAQLSNRLKEKNGALYLGQNTKSSTTGALLVLVAPLKQVAEVKEEVVFNQLDVVPQDSSSEEKSEISILSVMEVEEDQSDEEEMIGEKSSSSCLDVVAQESPTSCSEVDANSPVNMFKQDSCIIEELNNGRNKKRPLLEDIFTNTQEDKLSNKNHKPDNPHRPRYKTQLYDAYKFR